MDRLRAGEGAGRDQSKLTRASPKLRSQWNGRLSCSQWRQWRQRPTCSTQRARLPVFSPSGFGFLVQGFLEPRSCCRPLDARPMVRPMKTQQIAPRTRAPAGRGRTIGRTIAGTRARAVTMATVRPPPLLNASRQLASCRAPRHCRLSTPPSSHATVASSVFFCVPTALYASDLFAELTFFSSLASETPPSRRFGRLSVRVLPCRRPSRAQISIK